MGFETYTWTCKFCGKLHIWNGKYKYCNCCDYKPNLKTMNEKNKAIELIEKFSTKRDALLAIDMMMTMYIALKGLKNDINIFYWKVVKQEIIKL